MKHNESLLCVTYDTVDIAQRVAAIEMARRAGRRFAEADEEPVLCDCPHRAMPHRCPASAQLTPAQARVTDYVMAVLEPAHHADVIDMNDPSFRIDDFGTNDPRVAAFIEAANAQYQEIFEEMQEEEQ